VLWFAEQSGRGPQDLATSELVQAHAQAEERRRRTRAVPESNSYSLRMEDVAELLGMNGSR
jgi:hypothetical protein